MRSTENVRGEWDELGERAAGDARDTRVIVPGPGVGSAQGGTPGEVAPKAPVVVGPVVGTAAVEDDIPADLGPALDAVAGVGRTAAATGPAGDPTGLGLGPDLGLGLELGPGGERESGRQAEPEPATGPADLGPGPSAVMPPESGPADREPVRGPEPLEPGQLSGSADLELDLELDPPAASVSESGPVVLDLSPAPEPDRELGLEPDRESGLDLDRELDLDLDREPMQGPEPLGPEQLTGPVGPDTDPGPGPEPLELGPDLGHRQEQAQQPEQVLALSGEGGVEVEPPAAGPQGWAWGEAPDLRKADATDPGAWWGAGRRQPVITTETTAPIPVHLLFRDDDRDPPPPGGPGIPGGSTATGTTRRPPLPRSRRAPQRPTRPAPLADPRLTERRGPELPGWAALFTAASAAVAGLGVLGWQGALPAAVTGRLGLGVRAYDGIGTVAWALLGLVVAVVLFALCGLGRGRSGHASVLTLFGDYRGSVRRTGLLWISPLLRRRRVDVRLRHWRSEALSAVDASGTALRAVVLVVWRVRDTARATLGVADHERYLRDQVEAALARVLSQLPADAFDGTTRTLRDAEAVGDALTRMVKADCVPVGIEVYSAQPTAIEYAPEVAAAMRRCRVAAIDAKHRDGVLTAVVDAVDDTVGRLTARGIVELDAYEHKALVRDLTVAFYTGRGGADGV